MEVSVPSACLRVFSIPELAQSVCAYPPKQDIARLSQLSRPLFYYVSAYAWEIVDDVVVLMSLIPGAGVVTYTMDPLPALTVMQFPESYDLSCFDVYAPYVEELKINSTTHIDEYDNRDSFPTFTQSRSLSPNLKRIRLAPFAPSSLFEIFGPAGGDTIKWPSAFLSTSLREL
ncbi:hypothetical protein B0J17DRAFT_722504 [Rhizoctonia solani]|nr:hypothetical protein B0J17DRAFT_722504 [Rhizoctonia solani]